LTTLTVLTLAVIQAQPPAHRISARASAADYAASASAEGVTYAATQLALDQVRHIFASDISKLYIVFEVACFPSAQAKVTAKPFDFLIKAGTQGEYAHPADGVTVASVMQQKTTRRDTQPPITPMGGVGVGVGSATDPATGRKVHSVYTEAEAGVTVGGPPLYPTAPGSGQIDRSILEAQLMDRALPEGQFLVPVAGYLYFPAAYLKKHGGNHYEMEYVTSNGRKVLISVPASK
jgi:hypothetical protein